MDVLEAGSSSEVILNHLVYDDLILRYPKEKSPHKFIMKENLIWNIKIENIAAQLILAIITVQTYYNLFT